jgi:imidazolonepropionase-like amidohydrolase
MRRPALAVLVALVPAAGAQSSKPVPTAITNARVVVSADKTLEKATVILRDGRIADVGEGEVIVGPVMDLPTERHDPYDAPYANTAKLYRAGVKFCIRSTGSSNARNLPYEAAMAVAYGLPPEEARKAVTIHPARILGLADQLGSVEAGKRANLVLTNGDLLQPSTHVPELFIDGKPLEPTSKQTRLYEKSPEQLKEVKDGRAPLGTK